MQRIVAGVDGCGCKWLAVVQGDRGMDARIVPDLERLLDTLPDVLIGIDVPIGLPNQGSRTCDVLARKLLGRPRGSSVFPAPIRACLEDRDYRDLCSLHKQVDGRGLSKQAFHLLPKIRQVDDLVRTPGLFSDRIREVHPEVSFALWNDGQPMRFNKKKPEGRRERERLIDREWPGDRERLARELRGSGYAADDLNDAFAALWSSRRIAAGEARMFPGEIQRDAKGLPMRIEA
jgi:predicted RNase H-like nuclease